MSPLATPLKALSVGPLGREIGRAWTADRRGGLWLFLGLLVLAASCLSTAAGQSPGTDPPKASLRPGDDESDAALKVDAFLFLDAAGTPVMMPGMSWEEIDRLKNQQSGIDASTQGYVYQSLEIEGEARGNRAELGVTLRVSVEPTEGRPTRVPLRMRNFRLLEEAEVEGVDWHELTVAPDGSGYLLRVRSEGRVELTLRMRMSARVEALPSGSMKFDLPEVPSSLVSIRVGARSLQGEVLGRGDEVVRAEDAPSGGTRMLVESGGGEFTLRWSPVDRGSDDAPLLDVESRITLSWDDPEGQPIVLVQMTVRNLRGPISSFEFRVPRGAFLLDDPTVQEPTGSMIEVSGVAGDTGGSRHSVSVPDGDRPQRIVLSMELQLESSESTADEPLVFSVPTVIDSTSQQGELEVETGSDYRLRWRSQPWVQNVAGESTSEGSSLRSYLFRFDRGTFTLPLWLSAEQRQLRVTTESEIMLYDTKATLRMTIRPSGQGRDGRITLDPGIWNIRAITDVETGEAIDSFDVGDRRELVLNARGGDQPAPVEIVADTDMDATAEAIRLTLPRIIETDEALLAQGSSVTIRSSGRSVFVVDMTESTGIDRMSGGGEGTNLDSTQTRFALLPTEAPVTVVGSLVEQPQRITVSGSVAVELDGTQLQTSVEWLVTSQFDLEGRLPIRIESAPSPGTRAAASDGPGGGSGADAAVSDGEASPATASSWLVTVDGVAALLRPLGRGRFELISDRLTSGPVAIRFRRTRSLPAGALRDSVVNVPMPRPGVTEVAMKGVMSVSLRGDGVTEVTTDDAMGARRIELDSLPRNPLAVRLHSRASASRDLSIRRAVIRTAVGYEFRHEQVVAVVHGGDTFEVGLPAASDDIVVEAIVDERPQEVRLRGETLSIALPTDGSTHRVDLRIWIPATTPAPLATIRPWVQLPVGLSRVFWQLTVPENNHVVWASPTVGRAMRWRFDRWRLYREPVEDDRSLMRWAGVPEVSDVPPGNRYLYVGSSVPSFRVVTVSRGLLWGVVGSAVLVAGVLLTYVPALRHPLVAIAAAVAFAGLVAIAPDAAILAGQLGAVALLLVVIMIAARALMAPRRSSRVLTSYSTAGSHRRIEPRRGAGAERRQRPAFEHFGNAGAAAARVGERGVALSFRRFSVWPFAASFALVALVGLPAVGDQPPSGAGDPPSEPREASDDENVASPRAAGPLTPRLDRRSPGPPRCPLCLPARGTGARRLPAGRIGSARLCHRNGESRARRRRRYAAGRVTLRGSFGRRNAHQRPFGSPLRIGSRRRFSLRTWRLQPRHRRGTAAVDLPRLETAAGGTLTAVLEGDSELPFRWSLRGQPDGPYQDFELQLPGHTPDPDSTRSAGRGRGRITRRRYASRRGRDGAGLGIGAGRNG